MKIAISKSHCYTLSSNVIKKYFDIIGLGKPYFYVMENEHIDNKTHTKYKLCDNPTEDSIFYASKHYIGEFANQDDIFSDPNYFEIENIKRDDKNLITAVEESEQENIKIVEIPDDVEWYIFESESGIETIHEKHRIWF